MKTAKMTGKEVARDFQVDAKINVRELARKHTSAALNTLVRLMKAPKTPAGVKRQCAADILSQGWGRPDSRADSGGVHAEKGGLTINIMKLSTGQIETITAKNDGMDVIEAIEVAGEIAAHTESLND